MKQVEAFAHRRCVSDLLRGLRDSGFERVVVFDVKDTLHVPSACEQCYSVELGEPVVGETQIERRCDDAQVVARRGDPAPRPHRPCRCGLDLRRRHRAGRSRSAAGSGETGAGHDHATGKIEHETPLRWALGPTATFLVAEVVGGLPTNSLACCRTRRAWAPTWSRWRSCWSPCASPGGTYLEVWSDMLGSVGVIAAAAIIPATGWTLAGPILAALIGLWGLTVHVMLKRADGDAEAVRRSLAGELDEPFGIEHVTIPIENAACAAERGHA